MARDYDKELADAEAKVARIRKAKEAAERRKYEPVGRAFYAAFGSELSGLDGAKELKRFAKQVREAYDAVNGHAGRVDVEKEQTMSEPVSEQPVRTTDGRFDGSDV